MNTSHFVAAFATVLAACSVSPDTADVSDPEYVISSLTGGPPACTIGSSCYTGGHAYPCALDPSSGSPMCCITGCVDDSGYCRPGTTTTACGAAGGQCDSCGLAGTCVSGTCTVTSCSRATLCGGATAGSPCCNGTCMGTCQAPMSLPDGGTTSAYCLAFCN